MDQNTERVLAEIIDAGFVKETDPRIPIRLSPKYDDLVSFAELLSHEPREEDLQKYIEAHPGFLLGMFGDADGPDVAFIAKPRVNTAYVADFAVMSTGQGGSTIHLIEIERSSEPLFTRKNTPAETFRAALGQIDDWRQWISLNTPTFTRDIVDRAKNLPHYHERGEVASFRSVSPETIEHAWRNFGGYDHTFIQYTIILGRWGLMSEPHRKRLIYRNQQPDNHVLVYTYDEMARRAYGRMGRGFW